MDGSNPVSNSVKYTDDSMQS